MKEVVGVSIGSSRRNHQVTLTVMGETVSVRRVGTDGSIEKAMEIIAELDGKVDAIGLGGIDLYLWAGTKRYCIRDAKRLAQVAKKTPIVDGSGLKNTLERRVIEHLNTSGSLPMADKKVLLVSGMDRFGMAEALTDAGARLLLGDLIFVLNLPIPLYSLKSLHRLASVLAPPISQLPFKYLYPVGSKQDQGSGDRHQKYYAWADVVAGDFHLIRKYLPPDLAGKWVITNTTTQADQELLKSRGVAGVITTTPVLEGRSFGTNVMEALMVSLSGEGRELTPQEYTTWLDRLEFVPSITRLAVGAQ